MEYLPARQADCQQRDALQAARPAECWCLGLGGRGRVVDPQCYVLRRSERNGRDYAEHVPLWREYCACPDGQRVQAEHAEVRQTARTRLAQERLSRLWGQLPAGLRDFTLASFPRHAVEQRVLAARLEAEWLPTDRWLFLFGEVGRGKTGLSVGLLKALIDRGNSGLFVEVTELLRALKRSYGRRDLEEAGEYDILASLFSVDVLLLDDIGAERHRRDEAVDWAAEQLWQVVSHRYNHRRRTILTSNLRLFDLAVHLGHPRAPDRIRELADLVEVTGPSLRTREGA